MSFKETHPEFAPIQGHIERLRLERAATIGAAAAEVARSVMVAIGDAFKRLGRHMERGYAAELDSRAIEADAFLRRSAPRY
jgi:hypothetical protein